MSNLSQFSIDQHLKSLRERLSKSGAFTYDNIDELECHILDGYEMNLENNSKAEAYQLSMESLGDPKELTELYYQSNQKNIWRNYFWIISLTTFLGLMVFQLTDFFFQLILLTMAKLNIPIWYEYMDIGFGITAGIFFIFVILFFRKRASSFLHRIVARLIERPQFAFMLLVLIPIFSTNFLKHILEGLMSEQLSSFAHSARGVYGIIMFLAPMTMLFWAFWKYKKKSFESFEDKLAARLGLCAIFGISMTIIVNLSNMIITDGFMATVFSLKLGISPQLQIMIPLLIFAAFWSSIILIFYQKPQFYLGKLSQFISRNILGFLALCIALFIGTLFLANFTGSLVHQYTSSENMGLYVEYRHIFLERGFTYLLLALVAIWSFRRSKKRKMIAWS